MAIDNNWALEQENIRRQRALADTLRQQAMQPMPTQYAGGMAIKNSPLLGLAQLGQAYIGSRTNDIANQNERDLVQRRNQAMADTLRDYQSGITGQQAPTTPVDDEGNVNPMVQGIPNQQAALAALLRNPDTQQVALHQIQMQPELEARKQEKADTRAWQEQQAALQRQQRMDEIKARGEEQRSLRSIIASTKGEGGGKAPAGYRFTKTGDLEAIPGGPADLKKQGAFNADTASLQSSTSALDRLAEVANSLKSAPGLKGITGVRGVLPNIPGSDAANAQAQLETLKSQTAFGVLQAMRDASKTGGALGAVSEKELGLLQNNLAALDKAQSMEAYQKELGKIVDYVDEAKGRLRNAYNTKHMDQATGQSSPALPSMDAIEAELARRNRK